MSCNEIIFLLASVRKSRRNPISTVNKRASREECHQQSLSSATERAPCDAIICWYVSLSLFFLHRISRLETPRESTERRAREDMGKYLL